MESRALHTLSMLWDLPASAGSSFLRMVAMVPLARTCRGGEGNNKTDTECGNALMEDGPKGENIGMVFDLAQSPAPPTSPIGMWVQQYQQMPLLTSVDSSVWPGQIAHCLVLRDATVNVCVDVDLHTQPP